jgi:uridine phosphorylase
MAILDFSPDRWLDALGWTRGDVPDALVLEGTWWRDRSVRARLADLADPRETVFPDIFTGRSGAARVAYSCAYGAARAAEVAHVFAQLGTPLIIQIGTCGALQPGTRAGMVAVPRAAIARDGVTPTYGGGATVPLSADWGDRAVREMQAAGVTVIRDPHLTWTTLFAQSDTLCDAWMREGIATVDMETAVVATVAARFGAQAVALLATWDILGEGRTFLDPIRPDEAAALAAANEATWTVALALAWQAAAHHRTDRDTRDAAEGRQSATISGRRR